MITWKLIVIIAMCLACYYLGLYGGTKIVITKR